MTKPTAVRQPQPDPLDALELPLLLRWYLKLGYYVTQPLALYGGLTTRTENTLVPLVADQEWRISAPLLAYMAGAERALVERGFAAPFRAVNEGMTNVKGFVSLVEHPAHRALGFVFVSEGEYSAPAASATFRTDFADGRELVTTNFQMLSRTPSRPHVLGVRLRDVHDVGTLYDVHQFRVAERARTVATVPLTRGADPIAFQARESLEVFAFWMKKGYYRPAGPGAIRLTRLGALLAAYRGLFPWKQLTTWHEDRDASAVMRAYEASGRPTTAGRRRVAA
jgi:hypothetical protein